MAKTDFQSADEYIKTFPADKQAILEEVRAAIRKAVPDAEEVISYQIPAFRLPGGWVFYYSMYTSHFSLACPPPFAAFKEFAKELSRYKQSKSAVNFPLDEPVPAQLIERMSKFQAEEILSRTRDGAKGSARPKSKTGSQAQAKPKSKGSAKAKSGPKAKVATMAKTGTKAKAATKAPAKIKTKVSKKKS